MGIPLELNKHTNKNYLPDIVWSVELVFKGELFEIDTIDLNDRVTIL